MGKHLKVDAVAVDSVVADAVDAASAAAGRHSADTAAGFLHDDAVISPDTHVGTDFDRIAPGTPDAAPSPSHPDRLTDHGLVGDGHELE